MIKFKDIITVVEGQNGIEAYCPVLSALNTLGSIAYLSGKEQIQLSKLIKLINVSITEFNTTKERVEKANSELVLDTLKDSLEEEISIDNGLNLPITIKVDFEKPFINAMFVNVLSDKFCNFIEKLNQESN